MKGLFVITDYLEKVEADLKSGWMRNITVNAINDTPVAVDDSGWQTLYFHSKNDSYWERTYPKGDMHGGGPPRLRKVAFSSELKSKYGI